jgi:hypothetical protein
LAEEPVVDAEPEAAESETLVEILLVADAPYAPVAEIAPAVPLPVSKKIPPAKADEEAVWEATCETAWVATEVVADETTEEVVEEATDVLVAEVLEVVEVVEVVRATDVV